MPQSRVVVGLLPVRDATASATGGVGQTVGGSICQWQAGIDLIRLLQVWCAYSRDSRVVCHGWRQGLLAFKSVDRVDNLNHSSIHLLPQNDLSFLKCKIAQSWVVTME